jgi:hypothetical protein
MLFSLIYTSQATTHPGAADLHSLVTCARAYNAAHHLTGVLLYSEGQYLQVLEGNRPEVEALFAKIKRDPRHHDVQVRRQEAVSRREFPHWGMGFQALPTAVFAHIQHFISPMLAHGKLSPEALPSLRGLLEPFVHHRVQVE